MTEIIGAKKPESKQQPDVPKPDIVNIISLERNSTALRQWASQPR